MVSQHEPPVGTVRPRTTPRRDDGPPTGGLHKALYVLQMHWWKDQTKGATRLRHVIALRRECEAFLERTKGYE